MIYRKICTRFRKKALFILTDTKFFLFLTGSMAEIRSRSAYIMNIAFEIFFPCHFLRFPKNGFMASGLYYSSLMKGQRTEITTTKTASVTTDTKLNLS